MLQYKAGYKFVEGGVHAQVLDFPAAITCADELNEARRLLALALVDVAEASLGIGKPLPVPNPLLSDPEMDIEEPVYLHLRASSDVHENPSRGHFVKRQDLIQQLQANGCRLLREGRAHSVWINPANDQQSAVPHHREIKLYTVRAICRQLGIAEPE